MKLRLISLRAFGALLWIYSVVGGILMILDVFIVQYPAQLLNETVFIALLKTVPLSWMAGPLLCGIFALRQPDRRQRQWITAALAISGLVLIIAFNGHLGHAGYPDAFVQKLGSISLLVQSLGARYCATKVFRDARAAPAIGK